MKRLVLIVSIIICFSLVSCNSENTDKIINENNEIYGETDEQNISDTQDIQCNIGGTSECPVHGPSDYHFVSSFLIQYVGQEKYDAWCETLDLKNYEDNGCTHAFQLMEFIEYFDISKEFLIEHYYTDGYYSYAWDIDVVSNRDREAWDRFSRNHIENYDKMTKLGTEGLFKDALYAYIKDSHPEFYKKYYIEDRSNTLDWSIPQLVYETEMSIETLREIYQESTYSKLLEETLMRFDYNFEKIYTDREYIEQQINSLYPVQIDELIRIE